jgi:putative membrane protein
MRAVAGRDADESERQRIGSALHMAFGISAGAAYGALAEVWPRVTTGAGTVYGTAVWLAADEAAMPLIRLGERPEHSTFAEHAMVFTQHLAFGALTELVRYAVVQWGDGW